METDRGRIRDSRVRRKQVAQRCPARSTGTRLSRGPHTYAPPHFSFHLTHTQGNQSPWSWEDPQNRFLSGTGCAFSWSLPLLFEYGVLFYVNIPTSGYSLPPRQPAPLLSYSDFKKVFPSLKLKYTSLYLYPLPQPHTADSSPQGILRLPTYLPTC